MRTGLSLVVPAFNEAARLERALPRLKKALDWSHTELVVVDDGSSDDTAGVALAHLGDVPTATVVRMPHAGKGAAVRAGVMRARGEVIAYMDADMATDLDDLRALVDVLSHHHVAVGSRAMPGSVVHSHRRHRHVMGRAFAAIVARLARLPTRDTQCGFKAFRGPVAKLVFHSSRVYGFAFDVEVLSSAARLGLSVQEVPVRWTDVPGSHVRPLRHSLEMLGDLIRIIGRRSDPTPIHAVFVPDADDHRSRHRLRRALRSVDPLVSWQGGSLVLLPCAPPTSGERVIARLRPSFGVDLRHMQLTLGPDWYSPAVTDGPVPPEGVAAIAEAATLATGDAV